MRKLTGIILLFLLVAGAAVAQDFPKAEIFGGYQFTRQQSVNWNGWDAALTGNFNKWLGMTGDFSGAYKSQNGIGVKSYTFTFGPTVAARSNETFTPFGHVLLGGFHQVADASGTSLGTNNGFAFIAGGGVDAKITPHIAARLGAVRLDVIPRFRCVVEYFSLCGWSGFPLLARMGKGHSTRFPFAGE